MNVAVAALRAGREPERTLGGIEDSLSAAAVGVVDELVEPHAGVWPDVQAGLVMKPQADEARWWAFICYPYRYPTSPVSH